MRAFVAFTMLSCASAPAAEDEPPPPLVQIELMSSMPTVSSGAKFQLATVFRVASGWHIYGEDPGDAGLPTKVSLQVPKRFVVGETIYPEAERFTAPGNITTFGYKGVTSLSTPVEAADPVGAGPVEFVVRATWLACKEVCIPGEATTSLIVPAAKY